MILKTKLNYRTLREHIRYGFLNDPPHKLAFAVALGVFVAFTPTIGLHTFTSVFLAWMFRVSAFIAVAGSLVMNPWTLVPLYGFCLCSASGLRAAVRMYRQWPGTISTSPGS